MSAAIPRGAARFGRLTNHVTPTAMRCLTKMKQRAHRWAPCDESLRTRVPSNESCSPIRQFVLICSGLAGRHPHRVIPNSATRRWCRASGAAKALPAAINARSAALAQHWRSALGGGHRPQFLMYLGFSSPIKFRPHRHFKRDPCVVPTLPSIRPRVPQSCQLRCAGNASYRMTLL